MIRYETTGVQLPADALQKLADVFGETIDYLVNGTIEEKAKNTLQDADLLQQFKEVEKIIDAFITKGKLNQLML